MSKPTILHFFTLAFLLSFCVIHASRPNLALNGVSSSLHELKKPELDGENCEGVEGIEECLMRRTLAAHIDYIYTGGPSPGPPPHGH